MADIFTPEKRSQVMSRIRSRYTKPELVVRSILHGRGYRFTVNSSKNKPLPDLAKFGASFGRCGLAILKSTHHGGFFAY
jgi:G:T-mismatch repair DNA endonuclease (very short patch repair protein)